jgi:hypothetical protein
LWMTAPSSRPRICVCAIRKQNEEPKRDGTACPPLMANARPPRYAGDAREIRPPAPYRDAHDIRSCKGSCRERAGRAQLQRRLGRLQDGFGTVLAHQLPAALSQPLNPLGFSRDGLTLGKGEAESSILSRSTSKIRGFRASLSFRCRLGAVNSKRTVPYLAHTFGTAAFAPCSISNRSLSGVDTLATAACTLERSRCE